MACCEAALGGLRVLLRGRGALALSGPGPGSGPLAAGRRGLAGGAGGGRGATVAGAARRRAEEEEGGPSGAAGAGPGAPAGQRRWMAVPKRKVSPSRRRIRNVNINRLRPKTVLARCAHCGQVLSQHQLCPQCLVAPTPAAQAAANTPPAEVPGE